MGVVMASSTNRSTFCVISLRLGKTHARHNALILILGSVLRVWLSGAANRSYDIQRTGDLLTWSDAGSVLTSADRSAEFDVNIDPAVGDRFYRSSASDGSPAIRPKLTYL